MTERKKEILRAVLDECFWGDYQITLEQAAEKLALQDPVFEKFLAGRIVSESPYPSSRLRALFSEDRLRSLLEEITVAGRAERRRTLAKAVLFHTPWKEEPSWMRT